MGISLVAMLTEPIYIGFQFMCDLREDIYATQGQRHGGNLDFLEIRVRLDVCHRREVVWLLKMPKNVELTFGSTTKDGIRGTKSAY